MSPGKQGSGAQRVFTLLAFSVPLALMLAVAFTRIPWTDEGWIGNAAYTLVHNGFMGTTSLSPTGHDIKLPGVDRHTYWMLPGYFLALSTVYGVAGFSLFSGRLLSILFGLGILLGVKRIAAEVRAEPSFLMLAVLMVGVDANFAVRCSDARMDSMSVCLNIGAMALYLALRPRGLLQAWLAANVLTALGMMVHPNGILGVAYLCSLAAMLDWRKFTLKIFAAAAIPYVLAGAAYAPYVLQAPQDWRMQLSANAGGRLGDLSHSLPDMIWREVKLRYLVNFGFSPNSHGYRRLLAIPLAAYVLALVYVVARKRLRQNRGVRIVLICCAITQTYFLVAEGSKLYTYILHILPWFGLCMAIAIADLWTTFPRWRHPIAGVVAGLLLFQIAGVISFVAQQQYQRLFLPIAAVAKQHLSPGEYVIADTFFGFQLGFEQVRDDRSLASALERRPAVLILTDAYRVHLEEEPPRYPELRKPVADMLSTEYRIVSENTIFQVYARRTD